MPKPLFLSVNGTGVPDPFGPGFSGDIGRYVSNAWNDILTQFWGPEFANIYFWQPVGYPAAVFPMLPSVKVAVSELDRLVLLHERSGLCPVGWPISASGYSQGAIATGMWWRDSVLNPNGACHHRLNDIVGIVQFGDPLRSPGIANGNIVAGQPAPKLLDGQVTGGIAGPACLTAYQTPDFLLSCALDGDLYAASPVGADPWNSPSEVGKIQTRIYNVVVNGGMLDILKNAELIAEEFSQPLSTTLAAVQAIFGGLKFAFQGVNAPHWKYFDFTVPVSDWLIGRAREHLATL